MRLPVVLLCAAAAACQPASSEEPERSVFAFATLTEQVVDIRVARDGAAVRGASVMVCEPRLAATPAPGGLDDVGGVPLWQSGTSPDGHCRGLLELPADLREVDVVVQVPGLRGGYTDERLRERWGPFAPSAYQRVAVAQLASVVVELEVE
ncbi:MAG: hypothetical protein NXI31_20280 [bacterium]|nr:hypothetical protein [bacterium]